MYSSCTIDSHQIVSEQTGAIRYLASHSFSLRVTGAAMAPDFPEGLILIIDTALTAEPGDFVVVRNSEDAMRFRQLIWHDNEYFLHAVNPLFSDQALGKSEIIGVLRETVRRLR